MGLFFVIALSSVIGAQLRKPQAGIFANGSKGAEIKRANLLLNESDRARFEGDLQKILCDGKCVSKELKMDYFKKGLDRQLSVESFDGEDRGPIENLNEKLGVRNLQSCSAEMSKSSKRKMQDPFSSNERTTKKSNVQSGITKVAVQDMKVKPDKKNTAEKLTWKRSLFQDKEDEFKPAICDSIAMELRFSPRIVKNKVKTDQEKSKMFPDPAELGLGNKRFDSNYGQLGKMAITRYEELCAIVCAKNFSNCLREIPHADPLKSVKKYLSNFYVDSCRRKSSQNKSCTNESTPGVSITMEESNSSKNSWPIKNTKHCHGDNNLQRVKRSIPHHGCTECTENCFYHPEVRTKIHNSVKRQSINGKSKILQNKSRNETTIKNLWAKRRPPCLDSLTSEESSNCDTTNSLRVNNCESSKASLKTDFAEIDLKLREKVRQTKAMVPVTLAGIPENRHTIMLRYLRDQQLVKNQETTFTPEMVTSNQQFEENVDFQVPKCHGNHLKRYNEVKENNEKRLAGEWCLGELNIEKLKEKISEKIVAPTADRYLVVKMKNLDQEKSEGEIKVKKQIKRHQEAKKFYGNVHTRCEKHIPAILRKSRDRRLGKCSGSDFAELMFLKRKAQSSLDETLMENVKKPSKAASPFFVNVKDVKRTNRDRVQAENLKLNKKRERKIITCNGFDDQNFKSPIDRHGVDMTNVFEKSPSIDRLERLAMQISRSSIFLNDKEKLKDRSLFDSQRQKYNADTGPKNAEQFSPVFLKPRDENDEHHRFIFPDDNREPKGIIIYENNESQDRRTINGNNDSSFLHPNDHRIASASSSTKPIPFPNGRNGLRVPQMDAEILAFENFDPAFKKPRRRIPASLQPIVMYRDQGTVLKLGNDSAVYLEPTASSVVQNPRGEFHQRFGSIDGGQVQRWVSLPFAEGNSNLNSNPQATTQLFDGKGVQGLISPRNEQETYYQNVRVDPAHRIAEEMIQRQDYSANTTHGQNFAYKYISTDPYTCPRDGYERSQIAGSGLHQFHHQPVLQPVYNVTGRYLP